MEKTVLENTTLAMIVRDEENNPARGIGSNLPIILPHVQEAVVVDTGSVDNTLKILKRLQRKFPHLRIYERQFDGFASSRNYSLSKVRTQKTLVLDADELLTTEDFEDLKEFIKREHVQKYFFYFDELFPDGTYLKKSRGGMNVRLFDANLRFGDYQDRGCWESILPDQETLPVPISIKHFLSPHEIIKGEQWYENGAFSTQQPLENAKQYGWKEFNGWRRFFGNGEKNINYDSFRRVN